MKSMNTIPRDKLIVRKSFAMAFAGGEIWFEQLDALSVYKDIIKEKFTEDLKTIRRPSSPSLIAINLNETVVDGEIVSLIISGLYDARKYIRKVVFVGLEGSGKSLVKAAVKQIQSPMEFAYIFINDYEKAKEWLVNEQG